MIPKLFWSCLTALLLYLLTLGKPVTATPEPSPPEPSPPVTATPEPSPGVTQGCLPGGQLIVRANQETNLPKLTNTLNRPVTLKVEATGLWNFGTDRQSIEMVNANGSNISGISIPLQFSNIKPATLVAVKNNQAVAHGTSQTISLEPRETVSFLINDQRGMYFDNTGSQTLRYSFECK